MVFNIDVEVPEQTDSTKISPRGYKKIFMLSIKFLQLINVKMPPVVGILTFRSRKNSIIGLSEPVESRIS